MRYFTITLILTMLSTSSIALTYIDHGRIIDIRDYTSGNVTGQFDRSVYVETSAKATTKALNVTGPKRTNIPVQSDHSVEVKNKTKSKQKYVIEYQTCADYSQCYTYQVTIELDPTGSYKQSGRNTVIATWKNAGTYLNYALTNINGESKSAITSTANIVVY